jgi:hypothetical protein
LDWGKWVIYPLHFIQSEERHETSLGIDCSWVWGVGDFARHGTEFQSPSIHERPLNELTAEEKADGWKLLFDGKTFEGWEWDREGIWKINDGIIFSTNGSSHLFSKKTYLNMTYRGMCALTMWASPPRESPAPDGQFGRFRARR